MVDGGFPLGMVAWDVLGSPQGWENEAERGAYWEAANFYGTLETQPQGERLPQGWSWGFRRSPKAKRDLHPACQPQARGAKLS